MTELLATTPVASAPVAAPQPRSLLRLQSGGQVLAVPIEAVREILEVGRLTPLPRTPSFVRGVMNLRGAVVPVVDLSARLEHGVSPIERRTCIVVVEVAADVEDDAGDEDHYGRTLVVGLLVDAVYEVFDTDDGQIEPVPMLGTRVRADFLAGMTRARGQVIGVLNLPRVLSAVDLASLIASHQPARAA